MNIIYAHAKTIFIVICMLISLSARALTEPTDTILQVTAPAKVIITENTSGTNLEIQSIDGTEEIIASLLTEYSMDSSVKTHSREERLSQWWYNRNLLSIEENNDCNWGISIDGICIGLNKAVDQLPEPGFQWSKSFEIGWLSCLNVYYEFSRSRLSLGLGLNWRNYKITTSDKYLVANDAKGIGWMPYESGAKGMFSRLKIFSLQLPLLYEWNIPKSSISFKAGPILNFNTYASVKTVWNDSDGNRRVVFNKNIEPRRCTIDFFASLSLCKTIGIYVRYSPVKVMDSPNTINFRPLTVGLGLGI